MKKRFIFSLFLVLPFLLCLPSCKKKEEPPAPITVKSITAHNDNHFTFYEDEFNPNTITFTITMSNDETKTITLDNSMCEDGFNNLTLGKNTLKLVIESLPYQLVITIIEKPIILTSINIKGNNNLTYYLEDFNLNNIKFDVRYSNNTNATFSFSEVKVNTDLTKLKLGRNTIEIQIENIRYQFDITLINKPVFVLDIEVINDNNLTYYENEFDPSTISFLVIMNDGSEITMELTENMCDNGFDNFIIGKNTLYLTIKNTPYELIIYIEHNAKNDYTYQLTNDNNSYIITSYIGDEKLLVIPNEYNHLPVVSLNNNLFNGNNDIISVIIPNSILTIGEACFYNCGNLSTVFIPSTVNEIDEYALTGVKVILLEDKLINPNWHEKWYDEKNSSIYYSIEQKNIYYENNFEYLLNDSTLTVTNYFGKDTEITIPDQAINNYQVTMVGDHAFSFKNELTKVTMSNNITSLGEFSFANCSNLQTTILSNNLKRIESSSFCYCENLANIVLPNGLEFIGERVFNSCNSLLNIVIPKTVTTIGLYAFAWCTNMKTVYIYKTLINMAEGVFYSCRSLTISCEINQIPSTWHERWNLSNRPVEWNKSLF